MSNSRSIHFYARYVYDNECVCALLSYENRYDALHCAELWTSLKPLRFFTLHQTPSTQASVHLINVRTVHQMWLKLDPMTLCPAARKCDSTGQIFVTTWNWLPLLQCVYSIKSSPRVQTKPDPYNAQLKTLALAARSY